MLLRAGLLGRPEGRLGSSAWDWREEVGSEGPATVRAVAPSACFPTPCLNVLNLQSRDAIIPTPKGRWGFKQKMQQYRLVVRAGYVLLLLLVL